MQIKSACDRRPGSGHGLILGPPQRSQLTHYVRLRDVTLTWRSKTNRRIWANMLEFRLGFFIVHSKYLRTGGLRCRFFGHSPIRGVSDHVGHFHLKPYVARPVGLKSSTLETALVRQDRLAHLAAAGGVACKTGRLCSKCQARKMRNSEEKFRILKRIYRMECHLESSHLRLSMTLTGTGAANEQAASAMRLGALRRDSEVDRRRMDTGNGRG
jgi:hypothetical protein